MNSFFRLLAGTSNPWKSLLWALLITFVWLFFWYWPWQMHFISSVWLQLGIGLILFVIPGVCIYGLLIGRSHLTFSHITFGFVISHLLFALLGTLGRIIHLSFETVKFFMILMGLIFTLKYLLPNIRGGIKINFWLIKANQVLPIIFLLLVAVVACLVVIQRVLGDDDLTYLAYITNWQNSLHMDFKDILFGESEYVHPRFWIMSAPFAQALLTDVSKMPGILLLSGYYEPFLVILAVFSWYELARTLKFSPRAASASTILQLVFLLLLSEYLHPGAPFFKQLSADKATAAFIMAPVFFQSLIQSLNQSTRRNWGIFLLAGFSLTFIHPVILAYSVFIGGVLVLLNWKNTGVSQKILALSILVAVLLPQTALRFAPASSQVEIPYTSQDIPGQSGIESMVKRWGDTQYYGFNPGILDMKIPYAENIPVPQPIMARGWLVFPLLAAVFALRQAAKNIAAQFLLACFLLGFLAWFPFTGWIIGYFLSAYMLERALWLFPFGLSTVFTFLVIRERVKTRKSLQKFSSIVASISPNWQLFAVTAFAMGMFILYMLESDLPDIEKFAAKSQRYQGLAVAGQELDRQVSDYAYVVGSPQLNDLIPGISARSKIITYRISQPSNMSYFSDVQREERILDTKKMFSKTLSPEDKMHLLEKYDVQFLFLQSFDLRLFTDLIASYPDRIKVIEIGGVIILQIDRNV